MMREDRPIAVMRDAKGEVWSVSWSGDGRHLVSGSDVEGVRVYSEERGDQEWGLMSSMDVGASVYGVEMEDELQWHGTERIQHR